MRTGNTVTAANTVQVGIFFRFRNVETRRDGQRWTGEAENGRTNLTAGEHDR